MSGSGPSANFVRKLPGLLETGALSDLTLVCGDKTFKVHKIVLCTQSEVFRKLLDGKFKESGAAHIDLPDDDPLALQDLIHYLYHFSLALWRPSTSCPRIFSVQVYALADKYDVAPLRTLVVGHLNRICEHVGPVDDFVAFLRVVNTCTADNTLWDILLPKIKINIKTLLKHESFQELVIELPCLTLPLLGMLDYDKFREALLNREKSLYK